MQDDEPRTPPVLQNHTPFQWRHSGDHYFQVPSYITVSDDEAVSLLLPSKEHIYKLIIPHNPEKCPQLTGPMDVAQDCVRSSIGFERAIIREGVASLVKLGFSWGTASTKPRKWPLVISPRLSAILSRESLFRMFLVEETGRIILHPDDMIYVLDTCILQQGSSES